MPIEVTLECSSCIFSISLITAKEHDHGWGDILARLALKSGFEGTLRAQSTTWVSATDFVRLADFTESFVDSLPKLRDATAIRSTYVPLNLGFQIDFIDGAADQSHDGYLELILSVNVGKGADEINVYLGTTCSIDVKRALIFAKEIRELSKKLTNY